MYNTSTTSTDVINLIKPMVPLTTNTNIDNISLKFNVTLKNPSAADVTVTPAELLNSVTKVKITSNGNVALFDTDGFGIAILNAFRKTKSVSPFHRIGNTTVPANKTVQKKFFLRIDEGDIISALLKQLYLEVNFAHNVKETATSGTYITIESASVTYTTSEAVIEDRNTDLINIYGPNGEYTANPKIYEMSVDVPANTTLVPQLPLQYGCLIRRAIVLLYGKDGNGNYTPSPELTPDAIGFIATNPNRQILIDTDGEQWLENQLNDYFIDDYTGAPRGAYLMDFANTLAADGYGLKGWRFGVDDFQLAVKVPTACKMRVIFVEHVVNTKEFDSGRAFLLESPTGF